LVLLALAAGSSHKSFTYLPLSLARRLRPVRAKDDDTDSEMLLVSTLRAAAKCLQVSASRGSRITVDSARAAAALHAVLLNYVWHRGAADSPSGWSSASAVAIAHAAETFPSAVAASLHGWSPEQAAPIRPGGCALVARPACLSAALRAVGDSLVRVQGDASSQIVHPLSDAALYALDTAFVSIDRSAEPRASMQSPDWCVSTSYSAEEGGVLDTSAMHPLIPEDELALEGMSFAREKDAVEVIFRFVRRKLDLIQHGIFEEHGESRAGESGDGFRAQAQTQGDPFQRRERYSLYYEGTLPGPMGFSIVMFNNRTPLFDSSSPEYNITKDSCVLFQSCLCCRKTRDPKGLRCG
jgi:hypothetical protein